MPVLNRPLAYTKRKVRFAPSFGRSRDRRQLRKTANRWAIVIAEPKPPMTRG
jgi:hypothetical protein